MAEKIPEMEALIETLSEIFGLSTTAVSKKLLENDIRSFEDFVNKVCKTACEIEKKLKI